MVQWKSVVDQQRNNEETSKAALRSALQSEVARLASVPKLGDIAPQLLQNITLYIRAKYQDRCSLKSELKAREWRGGQNMDDVHAIPPRLELNLQYMESTDGRHFSIYIVLNSEYTGSLAGLPVDCCNGYTLGYVMQGPTNWLHKIMNMNRTSKEYAREPNCIRRSLQGFTMEEAVFTATDDTISALDLCIKRC